MKRLAPIGGFSKMGIDGFLLRGGVQGMLSQKNSASLLITKQKESSEEIYTFIFTLMNGGVEVIGA